MRLRSLAFAAALAAALAGCGTSISGTATPAGSSDDIHNVAEFAKLVGGRVKSDGTAHFTLTAADRKLEASDRPAAGEGAIRFTDSAADYFVSFAQGASGGAKLAIIGSTVSVVANDRHSGGRLQQQAVSEILDGPRGGASAAFIVLDSLWISHPESLDGAFVLVGSSSDTGGDGQPTKRYRLTSSLSKAEDLIDLHLGLPVADHSAVSSVVATLDYVLSSSGQITEFTANFADHSAQSNNGEVVRKYTFSGWGDPVEIPQLS